MRRNPDDLIGLTSTARFTEAARVLAHHVAEMGLVVPGFRTPPRMVGVNRTLRRPPRTPGEAPAGATVVTAGGAMGGVVGGVVAVRIADRPFTAVIGDMIEGVIVLNLLSPTEADRARTHLWRVMLKFTVDSTPPRRRDRPFTRVA